jgi:uncharacterized Zn finger protein
MAKLLKKGVRIQPVEIEGRKIARSFWGHGWCKHLESFSDYSNRLPRGRTYVRNGSVCHLEIQSGRIEAIVSGSALYNITVQIGKLPDDAWRTIKKKCTGQIGSVLELLRGSLSERVMTVVTDRRRGLFPRPGEIEFDCDCPDWAVMCKHVAAVLYGVGKRLDSEPELLFRLRGVDPEELISLDIALPMASAGGGDVLAEEELGAVFGIDIDTGAGPESGARPETIKRRTAKAKTASKSRRKGSKKPKRASAAARKSPKTSGLPRDRPRIRPSGKSVARLRTKLGLSVAEFAARLEVSTTTVRRWEAASGRLHLQEWTLRALNTVRR